MDIQAQGSGANGPGRTAGEVLNPASIPDKRRAFGPERIGQILGEWQAPELRVARGYAECRGLSTEQLEDIYQETALALYSRPYQSEEHLRNALRTGLKHRALRLHRDERTRRRILIRSAPGLRLMAHAIEGQRAPEPAALAKEDRLIASEFMTELTEEEQRVFAWIADGLQYRAIASVLEMSVNEARNLTRSCAHKRERFQLLYDAGRLCGYRAQTIQALQDGEATSEELAERAFAHLDSCAHCRAEHKTNANRLRRSFRDQAAALLPVPALVGHLGWLTRFGLRARTLQHRLVADGLPLGQGGVRERAAALLTGTGVAAKVATGVATVAVIAGGAVATHVLNHAPAHHTHHVVHRAETVPHATVPAALVGASPGPSLASHVHPTVHIPRHLHHSKPSRVLGAHQSARQSTVRQREPGGFAYLGVPTATSTPTGSPEPAHTATQSSGGAFSP